MTKHPGDEAPQWRSTPLTKHPDKGPPTEAPTDEAALGDKTARGDEATPRDEAAAGNETAPGEETVRPA